MNVLVVEFETSHGELLHSHLLILSRAQQRVYLAVNKEVKQQIPTELIISPFTFSNPRTVLSRFRVIMLLLEFIKHREIEKVVINTAHGSMVRDFVWVCRLLCPKVEIIGVAHYVRKFQNSISQRLINLFIRKYFLLNDLMFQSPYLPSAKGIKFTTFYPIFFPVSLEKEIPRDRELNITIAGNIIKSRRDYVGLVDEMKSNRELLHANMRFVFLGDSLNYDGAEIAGKLKKLDIQSKMEFFEGFIGEVTYHHWMQKTDVLLLLINPDEGPEAGEYLDHKISGTFNLSFGFKKPMVMAKAFEKFADFRETAFFYHPGELIKKLNDLSMNLPLIQEKTDRLKMWPKFSFEYQQANYMKFIAE